MLFNSLEYIVFLPIVALLYWLIPKQLKVPFLIAASYFFYMSWLKIYGLLLFGMTLLNYLLGLAIAKFAKASYKRWTLIIGVTLNLALLALFKYTNFILDSLKGVLSFAGDFAISSLPIALPLGISFFVFEFIHYLVDIRKGNAPIKSPLRFALFASFFPSQIAGPIKRYEDFDAQIDKITRFNKDLFYSGLCLITQGMFKKVALGDNLASIANAGFNSAATLSTADAWLATIAFALQIYYDFSGYTDIGRGSAMVLGFTLPENFNKPYLATSLQEFWHRWHISLSTWLRDYLYIPLGGSKKGSIGTARNLLITMLLGGLWHGASWHFVFWGGFHGLGLILNRLFDNAVSRASWLQKMCHSWLWQTTISRILTFIVVLMSWVLFRADNLNQAGIIYSAMFSPHMHIGYEATIAELFLQSALLAAFGIYILAYSFNNLKKTWPATQIPWWLNPPAPAKIIGFAGAFALIVGLAPPTCIPFLYFQF